MEVKTYGIYGLTEWHGKVRAGTIEVKLSFVGGTCSPGGTQPAYMVTKDPITQLVVENSKEYKDGFIRLVMRQVLPGTHNRIATHKAESSCTEQKEVHIAEAMNTVSAHKDNECCGKTQDANSSEFQTIDVGGVSDPSNDVTEVEFGTNQEAKDYLMNTFGVKSGSMKNRADIVAAGEKCGVRIVFVEE